MKLTVHIDEEDYIRYNIYHIFHSDAGRKAILKGRCLGFAISALVLFVMFVVGADKWLMVTEAVFLSIFSVVVFVTYPSWVKKKVRKQIVNMKKEGALPYVSDSTLEFRDDEIYEIRPDGVQHRPYSSFIGVEESEEYIYIRKGAQEVIIVPEKYLTMPREEFLAFLKDRIPAAE